MNICEFENIKPTIIDLLKNKKAIPLLGSGFSKGSETGFNCVVPSGSELKTSMLKELADKSGLQSSTLKKIESNSFSKVCEFFENQEKITKEYKRNFYKKIFLEVSLTSPRKEFLKIYWPYIYTLNFDDAIEHNSEYSTVLCSSRKIDERIFDEKKCVIKIHGDINDYLRYSDSTKVFTSSEYVESLRTNDSLLEKMQHDWFFCNFFIIGCSFDDELDLLSIQKSIFNEKKELSEHSRRMWFTNTEPDEFTRFTLAQYNITDVIVCGSYEKIYTNLLDAWNESKQLTESQIFSFSDLRLNNLDPLDEKENKSYFYFGKNLLNSKTNVLTLPFYFIKREEKTRIIKNFSKNTIHLIRGNKFSGRSYLLAGIYLDLADSHKTYIFNGYDSISDKAFELLLTEKNAVILFDINSINQNQFRLLINKCDKIHNNGTNVIVMLGNNSSDFLGVLKFFLMAKPDNTDSFIRYDLNNKFSESEILMLNEKLSKLTIPNFYKNKTILDNLILAADRIEAKSRFKNMRLESASEKELVFLIILAAKEKISSYDLSFFEITKEAYKFILKYPEIFEEINIENFEKNLSTNSQLKIFVNSKYWLTRELGQFAANERNEEIIIYAYQFLVSQTISKNRNSKDASKKYKDYILYDVINNTFLQNSKNERHALARLIMNIYEGLKSILANDYQYMHQYAKSCLHYSRTAMEKDEKLKYLNKAFENAEVSLSQTEVIMDSSSNQYLPITVAHIQYTLAAVYSEICEVEGYEDIGHIEKTVDLVITAISSAYNSDDYKRDNEKSLGIKKFIDYLVNCEKSELNGKTRKSIGKIFDLTRSILTNDTWEA